MPFANPVEKDEATPAPPAGGGLSVLLLLLLFTVNQWARSLIFYVVDFKTAPTPEAAFQFMNVDVGFDESQYGILASVGFAALFSVTSLVAGGIVERVDTRNLLTATAVLWSGATVWQGSAQSFTEVLGARMASGVGQAFANPASYTILSRLYPEDRRASVNGLYAHPTLPCIRRQPRPSHTASVPAARAPRLTTMLHHPPPPLPVWLAGTPRGCTLAVASPRSRF